MKATGILRRIDELGRVVIPKEIRKTMKLREGEELEIFTTSEEVILKKYSELAGLAEFSRSYADAVFAATTHSVCIVDNDSVLAAAGADVKDYVGKSIAAELADKLKDRKAVILSAAKSVNVTEGEDYKVTSQVIAPVVVAGDVFGGVVLMSATEELGEAELKLMNTAAGFFERQINR